jgi:hypothetical protein
MSGMKSIVDQIEVLYMAGVSDLEISRRLGVPLDFIEEAVTLIDEMNYHEDMVNGAGAWYLPV